MHALKALDTEFRFALFGNGPSPNPNLDWIDLRSKSGRWWSLVSFPRAARKLGAAAIHTQYSLSPLVGSRGITTIHDVSFLIGPEWFRSRDRVVLQTTVPAAAKRAAKVITVSETSRAEIERLIPAARGKTVATPLACPPWIELTSEKPNLEAPYVLTVGTRWPRKNMKLAMDAMERVGSEVPHRLVVTGKAGWGEEGQGSRVVSTGYVSNEELSRLYSHADLYLAPSRHEGFGLPVLEAFRCGCPVLASSGGALPETAGDAADIEASWHADQWAATIGKLLKDRSTLDDLRRRGFEREKQFSWRETGLRTLEVYREVAR